MSNNSNLRYFIRSGRTLAVVAFDILVTRLGCKAKSKKRQRENILLARLVGLSVKHVSGSTPEKLGTDDVVLLCVIKDGQEYLSEFIEHHQRIGVKHIVLLDNGSSDKSVYIASGYKGVTVLRTLLPFGTYARIFRLYLKMNYGRGCWSLSIDMDEFFDFPYSDKISLNEFVHYLNKQSFNAVLANMLEPVADMPLNVNVADQNPLLRNKYRYYDLSCIVKRDVLSANGKEILHEFVSGGIRASYFNWTLGHLAKYPLVKFDDEFGVLDSFNHKVGDGARLADVSCVLIHYQFTCTFHKRCMEAAGNENYGHASRKYAHYLRKLDSKKDINLFDELKNPRLFADVNSLLEDGYIVAGKVYETYVRGRKQ